MKEFFVKDKTGREYTAKLLEEDLREWENEQDWDGEYLFDYLETAEMGYTWEKADVSIIRIN